MLYDLKKQVDNKLPAIVFIVQPKEKNRFDQIKIYNYLKSMFLKLNLDMVYLYYVFVNIYLVTSNIYVNN